MNYTELQVRLLLDKIEQKEKLSSTELTLHTVKAVGFLLHRPLRASRRVRSAYIVSASVD